MTRLAGNPPWDNTSAFGGGCRVRFATRRQALSASTVLRTVVPRRCGLPRMPTERACHCLHSSSTNPSSNGTIPALDPRASARRCSSLWIASDR